MESAASGDGGERATVLTFSLEERRYCVRVDSVASVLGVSSDESVASAADPWNAGTVSIAGGRVRVVDLARAFNSADRTTARVDDPKLLVFRLTAPDGAYYGWLVDAVDVTRMVRESDLEATRSSRLAHVRGRLEIDGESVVWLDEGAIHG